MPIETVLPLLSNYFANPIGLLGLLALIPLAVFYLIKREPEEQMMPSFMFFHDDEEMSSTKSAFRRLMRNLLLLLHIVAIFGFAAAFAQPLFGGSGTPEHSILVLDISGSMKGDLGEAKEFLKDNTGKENTVIIVDNQARLVAERVSSGQAASIIDRAEIKDTGTDIAAGLEMAQRSKGKIFVASDLDQSADSTDIEEIFQNFRSEDRAYEIMDLQRRNSWGVVDIDVGTDNTTLEVKNFEDRENKITVSTGEGERELTVEGETVKEITFPSKPGKNTVELEDDDFVNDNKARFYIPGKDSFEVTLIADSENPYLMKAFELIDFTDITYRKPPIEEDLDSDMYIVGPNDRMISDTVSDIESDVRNGASLVLFGHQNFGDLGFENLPVKDSGSYANRSVTITEPERISLGRTEIRKVSKNRGERLSAGTNALIHSDYGNGEFLLYNIPDRRFNQEFLYPVFWKGVANEMLDRTPVDELNYRTGENIDEERIVAPGGEEHSGRTELDQQGFYDTSRGTVAVNMLNEDESLRDEIDVEENPEIEASSQSSSQNLVIALLLLMMLGEMGYLYRIGDIR